MTKQEEQKMIKYPKYKKVLFCTDFSENADYAFESFITTEDLKKIRTAVEEDIATNYKERYANKIDSGVSYKFVTRSGREDEEILAFAKKERVDLIVMGTHGRTGIEHVFFGSVAEKVLRHSPFPLFIIPSMKR
ncbi:MAG: universal stress protein, partial [Deltaproteobacteria bacterium]|nr:universal stress protein [Deltaproteobacteria bacterium]